MHGLRRAIILLLMPTALTFDAVERIALSNGQVVETFFSRHVVERSGSTLAIRTAGGYSVAVFSRDAVSLDSPGMVEPRRYRDYIVIWDEGYRNVLALEVDAPDPISGIFPMVFGVNGKNGGLTATLMGSTRGDPSALAHADRVRAAMNHLGSQFLGAVRTLYSLSSQQVEGVPSTLAALKTFPEMPEGVTIESRMTRSNAEAPEIQGFLRSWPIPTRSQTGFVQN